MCLIIINNTLDALKGCIVDMATVHSLSWTSHIYHNWSVPHGKFKGTIGTTTSQLTYLDWVEGRSLSYWWLLGFDRQMASSYKTTDITRWDDIIRQVVDIHIQLSRIIQYINIIPFKVFFNGFCRPWKCFSSFGKGCIIYGFHFLNIYPYLVTSLEMSTYQHNNNTYKRFLQYSWPKCQPV